MNSKSSVTLKIECKQLLRCYFPNEIKNSTHSNEKNFKTKTISKVQNILKCIHKSFRLLMTSKYYIAKCFVKRLKEKKKAFKLETTRMFFNFLLREIT